MRARWTGLCAVVLCASMACGQSSSTAESIAGSRNTETLFRHSGERAEQRLLPMVLSRQQATGDARTRLEAQLDLQVLVRWMAAMKPANDDRAAMNYLRMQQLSAAALELEKAFAGAGSAPLNNVQQNAARQLHQMTYDLPGSPDDARLDEVCRQAGVLVLDLGTAQATDPTRVPSMRPRNLPPAPQDATAAVAGRTRGTAPVDPSRSIPYLSVSQPLRQQLLATLAMVERPASHNLSTEDAAQLRKVLEEAIDISAGLAGNAGVAGDERSKLEQQLTESLALFSDRRLRDMGAKRIAEMGRYRQVLGSITKLNLSDSNYRLLAPAFEYAQKTPADSKRVLASVERFVEFCTIYDRTPATISYAANQALARTVQRPYDDSRAAFERARGAFLGAVEGLGGGTLSGTSPEELDVRLDEMRVALDVIDSLQAMPQALDTFTAYKQRTAGALERRIAKEASIAAAPGKGPIRQEAASVLKDLVRVAETARELDQMRIEGAELKILERYTRKAPSDYETKWKANVAAILDTAGAGAPLDRGRIERNEMLLPLVNSLPAMVAFEDGFHGSEHLQRWADWGIDERSLEQFVLPNRSAATQAFAGFLSDNSEAMKNWPRVQQDRRPITNFVLRSIGGAASLPETKSALHTHCHKLMTPLAGHPYADQRFVALCVAAMGVPDADAASNRAIRSAMERRMRN